MNNSYLNQKMNNSDSKVRLSQTRDEFEEIGIIKMQKNRIGKKYKKTDKERLEGLHQEHEKEAKMKIKNENMYDFLLQRLLSNLYQSNLKPLEQNKLKLSQIQVQYEGRRTAIINFTTICEQINRSVAHVMLFFINQLLVPGSLTQKVGFLIRQRLTKTQVENLFRKYVSEYVKCRECGSSKTEVSKYPKNKQMVMVCNNCKASRQIITLKQVKI